MQISELQNTLRLRRMERDIKDFRKNSWEEPASPKVPVWLVILNVIVTVVGSFVV